MSTLQGNAKKYSGAAIDYVLIFDWVTGDCIGKAVPNSSGVWTFDYFANMICGITYVADGCEPITHGSYSFEHIVAYITSGYLYVGTVSTSDFYVGRWDVTNTSATTWNADYSQTKDIGLFNYSHATGVTSIPYQQKIIEQFNINWILLLQGYTGSASQDYHLMTIEIMDDNNNVLAAVKSETLSGETGLWYGLSLNSLTKTATVESSPQTYGEIDFSANKLTYKNLYSSNYNSSFVLNVDLSTAAKIRVSGSAKNNATTGSYTGAVISVARMKPVQ